MTMVGWSIIAPGTSRLRNDETAIAVPNILFETLKILEVFFIRIKKRR